MLGNSYSWIPGIANANVGVRFSSAKLKKFVRVQVGKDQHAAILGNITTTAESSSRKTFVASDTMLDTAAELMMLPELAEHVVQAIVIRLIRLT